MIYSATLPAQTAGGAAAVAVAGVYKPAFYSGDTVTDVSVVAPAGFSTVTGAATNNVTLSVRQLRGGVVQQTFASLTLAAGTNLVAESPLDLQISAQPVLLAGDVIDVQMVQNGTGIAVGAGLLVSVYVS
ncbi:hypothetical protein VMT65_22425 [Nocardia sp. CDC153]|uniref:hypothetical protein n=1 Tax=Nocardia sp. CDC153 TaxID=3112167 RepID=UPI002DB90518|nr:hypothetical protein [Nocardia sp. CDC153]MEC3955806.1 hypothetical protein [Nocardia sp. CDC153]